MANPGGVGTKFVSVNLNKSYGQPSHHNHPPYSGQAAASRVRSVGSHAGPGGGMVVLSRPRSSQKAMPKLSIPPPLNLPSLRKEHEKFDSSGSGGGSAGGGAGSGSGSRPNSSGVGWTKPGTNITSQELDVTVDFSLVADGVDQSVQSTESVTRGSSSTYMPPMARLGGVGLPTPSPHAFPPRAEKAMVLRGEDFPSLHSALPTPSGTVQKQKDSSHKKHKQAETEEESSNEQRDSYRLSSPIHMRPQGQSSRPRFANELNENGGEGHKLGSSRLAEQGRKQEYFPSPLPVVRLNPRSDWADDERDTGHGFADRGSRDHGFPKSEAYWDGDFDMPKSSLLPHKPPNNLSGRWGQRREENGKGSSSEVLKVDPYRRDVRTPSREGNMWKTSPLQKDGFSVQEVVNDRNAIVRPTGLNGDMGQENKCVPTTFGDNAQDSRVIGNRDFARRDVGHRQEGRQHWNHTVASFSSRGAEHHTRDPYGTEQSSRYRGDAFQNSTVFRSSFSSAVKGPPINDPILNFGREKRAFSKSDRPYVEDPFLKDFGSSGYDERDPFSGGLVGVIKRKKDVVKQADFHDPVRESFEAELERVQKMQEMERQRIIEEQERALEQARREEEERQRMIREEEERRRRLEEEAREAAWRAEQEQLEAIQKAEEQKMAREEEKRRIFIEEERRKHAAKQKLLELEARMAKRQAGTVKSDTSAVAVADEKVPANVKEKDVSRSVDLDNWEDSERMVERITTSASSDSSALNRSFDMSFSNPSREGSSGFVDRGKPVNSWRRDVFENGDNSPFLLQDQEVGHQSPRQDASVGGRAFPRKEFYGGAGYMSSRTYFRAGMQEPPVDEFPHLKEHRWNPSGDGDLYNRNRDIEPEFYENVAEKYGDVGWGQGRSRGNPYSSYPERMYPNSVTDELYSSGRSRYSMRQPRVLPPPSLASMHKASLRGENERPGPSTSLENDMIYNNRAARSESTLHTGSYGGHQEKLERSELVDVRQENAMTEESKVDKDTTPRCDSQSSLSVSSPPSSPTHLFHDELDESGDSAVIPAAGEGKEIPLPSNDSIVLNEKSGKATMMTASSSISVGDEDEEWALENNEELQEQEEYDEDEDGYQEEDEVHEGYDENIDLAHEFEDTHLEEKGSSHTDNMVLGFNEGVEVGIPSDDFESNSRNEETKFGIPEDSAGTVEEQGSVDGIQGDRQILHPINETEKAIQDSVSQPINAPHTSMSSDQNTVPSLVDMAPHSSGQPILSPVSSVPSQADLPVIQFGLFSGPSLIPSLVPAIQIGSIQMPLHLHPPVGPSISHMHPSQPPLFQFGQLRYTSPISQGILPVAPQSMSFVQPNIQTHYNLNQNSGASLPVQHCQDTSAHNVMKTDFPSLSVNNQPVPGVVSRALDLSHENGSRGLNSFSVRESAESISVVHKSRTEISHTVDNKITSEQGFQDEDKEHHGEVVKNYIPSWDDKESEGQSQSAPSLSQSISIEKDLGLLKSQGPLSSSKGKKIAYSVRHSGFRSSFPASEASLSDSNGFQRRPRRPIQRTEFRIRENIDRRQPSGLVSSNNNSGLDGKSNLNGKGVGTFTRNGFQRGTMPAKPLKQIVESESLSLGPISSQEIDSESRAGKEALTSQGILRSGEGNLKRNISEEDVDAPLQSGVVRVFKQPGIEAPSDEDDFIEVRSKRQMLNDRREQREKEIKAKSRVTKPPRKPHSSAQSAVVSTRSSKITASNNIRSDFVSSEGVGLANKDVSTGFSTMVSQPLAPIGTPAVNTDTQADIRSQTIKSIQTGSVPVISGGGKDIGPSLIFETKNKVLDNVQAPLGSWGNAQINQQVMALTQTQLDEAMKPAWFDPHVASIGGHATSVSEALLPPSSILTKDKSISSSASPINSLLAGEKIQFGAVTSPTVLPPSTRVVSHAIGAPGSFRPDIQISHNLSTAESDCTLFFEKDKHPSESCVNLEDSEAEAAEAAASAVAVAAISSDEIVVNGLSVSVSDTKSFGGADIDGITGGVSGDQQSGSQSRIEESLSVSLPADLSVETPPISLWPPLPSPQNSSSQMLSHFPGAPPPSHFPFYEMNPMLGGPIFAFGPHEESGGTQSQPQKSSTMSGSGHHLGTWPQCHSTVDSFYGPPSGFTGPFISPPPGGIQAPPHMVVYNHYAPVGGQFGQVGLSFMGTTYIPSGKQPDWKHNPTSSAMGIGEGGEMMNNMNFVSAQRNAPNMPAPIQHLAPGSPLLPMPSPLAMYDVSPFQSAPDMSVQARWSHVPASALHSVPLSLPLQQQAEGVLPSHFSHGHPIEQSVTANRFSEPQTSTPSDATVTQFPGELRLVGPSSSTGESTQGALNHSSSGNITAHSGKTDAPQSGSSSNSNSNGESTNAFKTQQKNLSAHHHYSHSTGGYNSYQRGGGVSQKNSSMGEWSHRRMGGFHGRNQSLGAEKGFPPSKMKQIYVAKQTTTSGNPMG